MMAESPNNIEEEIRLLEERLKEARLALGEKGEKEPDHKEILRSVIRERMEAAKPLSPLPPLSVKPRASTPAQPRSHDETKEVERFVRLAFEKNIPEAVKAVRDSHNAHLLDALHDVLVDKFYKELVKRGKIKP